MSVGSDVGVYTIGVPELDALALVRWAADQGVSTLDLRGGVPGLGLCYRSSDELATLRHAAAEARVSLRMVASDVFLHEVADGSELVTLAPWRDVAIALGSPYVRIMSRTWHDARQLARAAEALLPATMLLEPHADEATAWVDAVSAPLPEHAKLLVDTMHVGAPDIADDIARVAAVVHVHEDNEVSLSNDWIRALSLAADHGVGIGYEWTGEPRNAARCLDGAHRVAQRLAAIASTSGGNSR